MRRKIAVLAACFAGLSFAVRPRRPQSGKPSDKPWRHALIQPKSDAGILLMPQHGGFSKKPASMSTSPMSKTTRSCCTR